MFFTEEMNLFIPKTSYKGKKTGFIKQLALLGCHFKLHFLSFYLFSRENSFAMNYFSILKDGI
jgi:hypothetical protein